MKNGQNKKKKKKSTVVKEHMLMCEQPVSFDDFQLLASSKSEIHLKSKKVC